MIALSLFLTKQLRCEEYFFSYRNWTSVHTYRIEYTICD